MPHVAPTPDQALCFYRAALATAWLLDHDGDTRVLDSDADTHATEHALAAKISPQTIVLVSAGRASAACARVFLRNDRLSIRSQFILVTGDPASRHALGITCALLHQAGLPLLADVRRDDAESLESWANREKHRLGLTRADLVVLSSDAPSREQQATKALATALGATETIDLAAS